MEHRRVLSDGELPIFLYKPDESADTRAIAPSDKAEESQVGSEALHEQIPGRLVPYWTSSRPEKDENGLPLDNNQDVAVREIEKHIATAERNSSSVDKLFTSPTASSNASHDPSDEGSESFNNADLQDDPSLSDDSSEDEESGDDPESPNISQIHTVGQNFQTSNTPRLNAIADSDLDILGHSEDKPSAASTAPFRGETGGVPVLSELPGKSLPRKSLSSREGSNVHDLGEYMYRYSQHRKPTSPAVSRTSERRRKTLQRRLFSALRIADRGNEEFFPKSSISTIITEQCVREELAKQLQLTEALPKTTIAEYAKRICEEVEYQEKPHGPKRIRCFRKIFMILVLIDKTPAIIKFLEKDINDSDLPLLKVERRHDKGAYDLRLNRDPGKRLKCFSKQWNQLNIRNFEAFQWKTLSPFFGKPAHKDVKHYPLQSQVILPFITGTRKEKKTFYKSVGIAGGQGRVTKVEIHPDHHNFESTCSITQKEYFAIKCLNSPDEKRFKREVEMLKRFSVPAQRHLISLLATYEQDGRFYLIFHWAEADLSRYWRRINPKPWEMFSSKPSKEGESLTSTNLLDWELVTWIAEQCQGIADAVKTIHTYTSSYSNLRPQPQKKAFGRHGDIKPENILWFPDADFENTRRGTLKLTDFGLAEISPHQTSSMMPKSDWATTPLYRAPEIDLKGDGLIGRSYDMWTLGCLYLEFITWLTGGHESLSMFYVERMAPDRMFRHIETATFFSIVDIQGPEGDTIFGAQIKPTVVEFIKKLYSNPACTNFVRDFLDMVKLHLLIVEDTTSEARGRINSSEVAYKLGVMLQSCKTNMEYACAPDPCLNVVDGKATEGIHASGSATLRSNGLSQSIPSTKYSARHSRYC